MERKEVTLYAMTVDDSRSVPIPAFDNGDGTFALRVSLGDTGLSQAVSLTDRSGTIAANDTSQQVMATNTSRKYVLIQNISATDLYINFGGDAINAAAGSFLLSSSGGSFVSENPAIVIDSIFIIGATAGLAYTAKEG